MQKTLDEKYILLIYVLKKIVKKYYLIKVYFLKQEIFC